MELHPLNESDIRNNIRGASYSAAENPPPLSAFARASQNLDCAHEFARISRLSPAPAAAVARVA